MINQTLFRRFLLRYLLLVVLTLFLVILITHSYQDHYFADQRAGLEAAASHWVEQREKGPGDDADIPKAKDLESIRVLVVNGQWEIVADTHPNEGVTDLLYLREEKPLPYAISLQRSLSNGDRAFFIKRLRLRFPQTFQPSVPWMFYKPQWGLIAILAILMAGISLFLFPFVKKLSTTLGHLAGLARDVANGHFGKQLKVSRKDELGGLVAAFNQMSRQLAEADQLNTRLIQDVSHELRSPLGRIRAFAEALKYRPENLEKNVAEIEHEIASLDRIVADLSQASKLEALPLSALVEVSLQEWAHGVFQRLAHQIQSAGLVAEWQVSNDLGIWRADPQRLTQAVGNLVENAIQALGRQVGGTVQLRAEPTADGWQVVVADNGPGIPEKDLPNVWRRFYRVSSNRSRDEGGVGLGLSIVRALVEQHGGRVRIQSEVGSGTAVFLEFPWQVPKKSGS